MSRGSCINCGSHAINHHMHGRDGTYSDFCDVCFWRIRTDSMKAVIDGQLLRIKDYQSACEQKQEIINGLQEQVTNQQIIIDDWIK